MDNQEQDLREAAELAEEQEDATLLEAEEQPTEPHEFLRRQRMFFDGCRQRAINLLPEIWCFANPLDHETYVQIGIAQEAGIAFCNTKDSMGGQLGNTVEDVAKRCVKSESDSNAKDRLIDDLKDENHDLRLQLVRAKAKR